MQQYLVSNYRSIYERQIKARLVGEIKDKSFLKEVALKAINNGNYKGLDWFLDKFVMKSMDMDLSGILPSRSKMYEPLFQTLRFNNLEKLDEIVASFGFTKKYQYYIPNDLDQSAKKIVAPELFERLKKIHGMEDISIGAYLKIVSAKKVLDSYIAGNKVEGERIFDMLVSTFGEEDAASALVKFGSDLLYRYSVSRNNNLSSQEFLSVSRVIADKNSGAPFIDELPEWQREELAGKLRRKFSISLEHVDPENMKIVVESAKNVFGVDELGSVFSQQFNSEDFLDILHNDKNLLDGYSGKQYDRKLESLKERYKEVIEILSEVGLVNEEQKEIFFDLIAEI